MFKYPSRTAVQKQYNISQKTQFETEHYAAFEQQRTPLVDTSCCFLRVAAFIFNEDAVSIKRKEKKLVVLLIS